MSLRGTFPAMLTPYNTDLSINREEYLRLARFGLECGLDGIFCNTSVGDSLALSFKKKVELMELSLEAARGAPVIGGIGSCVYEESLELAKEGKRLGLSALLLQPPSYYPLDEDGLVAYFEYIASRVSLPLYVYNIPLFTPILSHRVVERLGGVANIVGMKDSGGSAVDFAHFAAVCKLDLFVGREEFYLGGLLAGAKGSMTASGCVFPEVMAGIYKAFNDGDLNQAKKLQASILEAIRFASKLPFPIGFVLLLEARGFNFSNTTSPHPLHGRILENLDSKRAEAKAVIESLDKSIGLKNHRR